MRFIDINVQRHLDIECRDKLIEQQRQSLKRQSKTLVSKSLCWQFQILRQPIYFLRLITALLRIYYAALLLLLGQKKLAHQSIEKEYWHPGNKGR